MIKTDQTQVLSVEKPGAIEMAASMLANGELIAFPTDTVYGLACDPFNPSSLRRIYQVKQRPDEKAIPVLIGSLEQISLIVQSESPQVKALMQTFWPGALTLILPRQSRLPSELSPYPGIALRMPRHPIALELLRQTGPLAVTSANLSAHQNTLSAADVFAQLNGSIPLILDDGSQTGGLASTVIDCMHEEPVLLREGPIAYAHILEVWNADA